MKFFLLYYLFILQASYPDKLVTFLVQDHCNSKFSNPESRDFQKPFQLFIPKKIYSRRLLKRIDFSIICTFLKFDRFGNKFWYLF